MILTRDRQRQNPLDSGGEQELINTINTLPPTDMERIITIIQRLPQGQEAEEDIEIPLDESILTLTQAAGVRAICHWGEAALREPFRPCRWKRE